MAEEHGRIPMAPGLQATLIRARDYAAGQAHAEVALEHLLLALTEDEDAAGVMQFSSVDLGRLRNDLAGYLGDLSARMPGVPGSAPAISQQLTDILRYATLAAKQGRRQRIDGAIVLAALVGDGRSMAASFLNAQGLTFEEAIRILQRAAQQTPSLPPPSGRPSAGGYGGTRPPPQTEAILAQARDRVSSRTGQLTRFDPSFPEAEPRDGPQSSPHFSDRAPPGAEQSTPPAESDPAVVYATTRPPLFEEAQPAPATVSKSEAKTEDEASAPAPDAAPAPPPAAAAPPPDPAPSPPPAPGPPPGSLEAALTGAAPQPGRVPPPPPTPPPPSSTWSPPPLPVPGPPTASHGGSQDASQTNARRQAPPPPPSEPPFRQEPPPVQARGDGLSRLQTGIGEPPRPHSNSAGGYPHAGYAGPGASPPPAPIPPRSQGSAPPPAPMAPRQKFDPFRDNLRAPPIDTTTITHSVPERLHIGQRVQVEVRVGRTPMAGLGPGPQPTATLPEHVAARAISVRLRATKPGLVVEAISPETQWDQAAGVSGRLAGDTAVWRFVIAGQTSGHRELQLLVAARTIGADGVVADMVVPEQSIPLSVASDWSSRLVRWAGKAGLVLGTVLVLELARAFLRIDLGRIVRSLLGF